VPRLILAGVSPDNTPGGFYYTFLFPMLLFIVVAVILYMLFSRPHRRVPGRPIVATAAGRQAEAHVQAAGPVVADTALADGGSDDAPADTDPADVDAAATGEGTGASE
jgi:uncharacterized protein (DUF58 family)